MQRYTKHFDDGTFWKKISKYASTAGLRVIETALMLYYCFQDPATPAKARAIIIGALGYFILPLDAIPDFVPVIGFADDLAALAAALGAILAYLKPEHRVRAKLKLREWFPETGEP